MDLYLHEFECEDCEETLLLDLELANSCPYCQGSIDYSSGKIEVVATYTPRKFRGEE